MSGSESLREECGLFGITNSKRASHLTALGLFALQTPWRRSGWHYQFGRQKCSFQGGTRFSGVGV